MRFQPRLSDSGRVYYGEVDNHLYSQIYVQLIKLIKISNTVNTRKFDIFISAKNSFWKHLVQNVTPSQEKNSILFTFFRQVDSASCGTSKFS